MAECHDYRQFRQQQDESVTDLVVKLKRLSKRYAKGFANVEDLSEQMAKGGFLSLIPESTFPRRLMRLPESIRTGMHQTTATGEDPEILETESRLARQ